LCVHSEFEVLWERLFLIEGIAPFLHQCGEALLLLGCEEAIGLKVGGEEEKFLPELSGLGDDRVEGFSGGLAG
jgi:hypothetical protein